MAPVYKIAVIQFQPKDVAVAENYAKAESYIRKAAEQGAHLAVLPEYHLTSWCPDHPDFVSASAESATYLARYQALAKELDINIVPGTICEVHPAPDNTTQDDNLAVQNNSPVEIRNMAYWLAASTGAIAGAYQKKNLWHPERPFLTAGAAHTPHTAFDTPLTYPSASSPTASNDTDDGKGKERPIRAGLLICWDLAFPEAFRALIADGADLIVVPAWWQLTDVDAVARALNPDCEKLFLEAAAVARAFENTCAVVFCNAGGVSQVTVPILGALGGTAGVASEEMRVVEVDFDVLRVAEGNYKVRQDMRGEGWHYGYTLFRGGLCR